MKVALIGHTERNYLPFLEKYLAFLKDRGISADCYFWERERPLPDAPGEFHFYRPEQGGMTDKLTGYLAYRHYLKTQLSRRTYDRLILLTTLPGVLLADLLCREYPGRYLLDIRDYSFESFPPYRRLVGKLIRKSFFTAISSPGFRRFLPESPRLLVNHNLPVGLTPAETAQPLPADAPVCIGFVGLVRYFKENAALLRGLKNHPRFLLSYKGKAVPGCDLAGFCRLEGIENVRFSGKFANGDKASLYRDVGMVNALYGADSPEVTTALPNRLYEACLLKKPVLTSKGTYLGEVVTGYGLGVALGLTGDDPARVLEDWLSRFDPVVFTAACNRFLEDAAKDEAVFYDRLGDFLKG